MCKQFFDAISQIFLLTQETRQNKSAIQDVKQQLKEVQDEVSQLARAVERLAYEIHRVADKNKNMKMANVRRRIT